MYGHTHSRGLFSTKDEALKMSNQLGCIGYHENRKKWSPCKDEKQLHKYLRYKNGEIKN